MDINQLTGQILKCAFKVHTKLGPGLLESSYEMRLHYELTQSGLIVEKQKALSLVYDDVKLDVGYRVDLLAENRVVIEIKAIERFLDVHVAQVLTYLKLSDCKIGLLLNFNVTSLKNGIKRIANFTRYNDKDFYQKVIADSEHYCE